MKTNIKLTGDHFPISIVNEPGGIMAISYGAQTTRADNYDKAILEIGAAIMHAMTSAGRVPDEILETIAE